jgi:hypothetical protein
VKKTPGVDMTQLARIGAEIRLREIAVERAQIIRAFPLLGAADGAALKPPRTTSPTISAAQRAARSKWMKAYWTRKRMEWEP